MTRSFFAFQVVGLTCISPSLTDYGTYFSKSVKHAPQIAETETAEAPDEGASSEPQNNQ